jgi:hypothetical protein
MNNTRNNPTQPSYEDVQRFEQAYGEYQEAANVQQPDDEDLDAVQMYNSLQKLIQSRGVTTEQVSRKVAALIELQIDLENRSAPERLLLASIKQDLDDLP